MREITWSDQLSHRLKHTHFKIWIFSIFFFLKKEKKSYEYHIHVTIYAYKYVGNVLFIFMLTYVNHGVNKNKNKNKNLYIYIYIYIKRRVGSSLGDFKKNLNLSPNLTHHFSSWTNTTPLKINVTSGWYGAVIGEY